MKKINYLDGFSGYGGFHLALDRAGFQFDKTYFSEIDKFAIANYTYNYPNSIYAGSIKDVPRNGIVEKLDLFTFGWPCQDNSIAGKRKGQQPNTRSGLLYNAVEVIDKFRPRIFIAENVEGLRSVRQGIDFVESFKVLSFLNSNCPQYDIEMQLLNTRSVLPQNRMRLYFIGHPRGNGGRKVFPITENDFLDNKSRSNKKEVHNVAQAMTANQFDSWNGNFIIEANTKKGYKIAQENDTINLARMNSLTRRGRIGKGIANTLDTKCEQGVFKGNSIRRLTPIECERLQGLPDNFTKHGIFTGIIKEISDRQRYKLTGNGVSATLVEIIAKKILPLFND